MWQSNWWCCCWWWWWWVLICVRACLLLPLFCRLASLTAFIHLFLRELLRFSLLSIVWRLGNHIIISILYIHTYVYASKLFIYVCFNDDRLRREDSIKLHAHCTANTKNKFSEIEEKEKKKQSWICVCVDKTRFHTRCGKQMRDDWRHTAHNSLVLALNVRLNGINCMRWNVHQLDRIR